MRKTSHTRARFLDPRFCCGPFALAKLYRAWELRNTAGIQAKKPDGDASVTDKKK
ncbi:hypothetical protein [Leeia oryzae]|uniref:hypothetical protein n=1 Tax=Leeia oryzae TaxID=356662 RepID=UPI000360B467|nr:hypothetical protein [Leeia oryzae]